MTKTLAAALATLLLMPVGVAYAQSAGLAESFEKRADRVFQDHLRCANDITATRAFIRATRPEALPKYEEAMTSYMNRLYGVAEAVGRRQEDVTKSVLDEHRAHVANLANASTPMADARSEVAARLDRAKVCFRAIGYSVN